MTFPAGIFWDFWYDINDKFLSQKPLEFLLLQLVAGWPIIFSKMTGLRVSFEPQ